ncbi:MAG TPA: TonB-dependent receptor [Opitutaceae bacterium]|nr:TonB-dependent receptor [Opitutaceae bacterium]
MTYRFTPPPRIVATALCCAMTVSVGSSTTAVEQKRSYNLPSGDAAVTLNQFAGASGQQIIFMMDKVKGERTNAVAGEYSAREALDRMLAGTGLSATRDSATGAFVVSRKPPKGEVGAASDQQPKPKTKLMKSPSKTLAFAVGWLIAGTSLDAQSVSSTPATPEETIVLSKFTVSTTNDKGYRASNSVSATRIDTAIKDLPFAVSAFTEQFLTDIGTRDLTDVLKFAPAVTSGSEGFSNGNSFMMVRGFQSVPQRNGLYSPLYVDGSIIQRVEVVKGPASLFYGQIAPGGVVNYITKRAQEKSFGTVSAQLGSYDFARAQVDVNQPLISDRAFLRVNTAWENLERYVDKVRGDILVVNPNVTVKVTENSSLNLDYNWYRRDEEPQALMRQSILIPLNGFNYFGHYAINDRRYNATSVFDYKKTEVETVTADYVIRHGKDWTTRVIYDWNKSMQKMKQTGRGDVTILLPASFAATIPTTFKAASLFLNERLPADLSTLATGSQVARRMRYEANYTQRRTFQVETAGKLQFGDITWKPLFGYQRNSGLTQIYQSQLAPALWAPAWNIFDRRTWIDHDSPVTSWPVNNNTFSKFENLGAYSANQLSMLDDRLILVGGLRWSKSKARATQALTGVAGNAFETTRSTPQFGAGYKVRRDLMLYASYSESFIAANSMLATRGVADRVAAPFLGSGYEAGIKADFMDGRFSGNLAYFNNEQKNYIFSYVEFSTTGITLSTQVQDGNVVASEGVELELTYSPIDPWQIYFSASHATTEYTAISSPDVQYLLGTAPQYTARDRANLWTRYSFQGRDSLGFWVGAGFNYTGKKAEISNNPWLYLPAQTVFDAVVGYDWKTAGNRWSAKLTWKNLTDEDELQTVRERGQPARIIADITVRF